MGHLICNKILDSRQIANEDLGEFDNFEKRTEAKLWNRVRAFVSSRFESSLQMIILAEMMDVREY